MIFRVFLIIILILSIILIATSFLPQNKFFNKKKTTSISLKYDNIMMYSFSTVGLIIMFAAFIIDKNKLKKELKIKNQEIMNLKNRITSQTVNNEETSMS